MAKFGVCSISIESAYKLQGFARSVLCVVECIVCWLGVERESDSMPARQYELGSDLNPLDLQSW